MHVHVYPSCINDNSIVSLNSLLVKSPYTYVFNTTFVCVCFFLITLELNRTPQDTTAASRQTDPEYLSDSDNDTESLATDDFLCSKSVILCAHAVNFACLCILVFSLAM